MKKLLMILAVLALAAPASAQLVITGLVDGPLTGGLPKVVELYACDDIADLSIYGIGSANNGGGTDGVEATLSGSAVAGQTIFLSQDYDSFVAFFGFDPDLVIEGGPISINGDDAVELFLVDGPAPVVVDVFGDIDMDGTGLPWDHLDGWAKRNVATGPGGSVFVVEDWTYSGPNALDDELTNADAVTPFPLGTYTCDPSVASEPTTFGNVKSLYR
jgi:hypothetical protein|nr:hypothetical protein [Candidatus Krumholzibacteria bacterium]